MESGPKLHRPGGNYVATTERIFRLLTLNFQRFAQQLRLNPVNSDQKNIFFSDFNPTLRKRGFGPRLSFNKCKAIPAYSAKGVLLQPKFRACSRLWTVDCRQSHMRRARYTHANHCPSIAVVLNRAKSWGRGIHDRSPTRGPLLRSALGVRCSTFPFHRSPLTCACMRIPLPFAAEFNRIFSWPI
jgi:hypothetical protein